MVKFQNATTPFYQPLKPRDFGVDDIQQVLVVSDLHLSEGRAPGSAYWDRLENFTYDEEFAEFLQHKLDQSRRNRQTCMLIINGDFIDFLRITRTPDSPDELQAWKAELQAIPASYLKHRDKVELLSDFDAFATKWQKHVLQRSLRRFCTAEGRSIRRERRYGLETEDFKSVYRLNLAWYGHAPVFAALKSWLQAGFPVIIITGNHDQEFDQELVQAWLRLKLEIPPNDGRLQFCSQGVELWRAIRVEHGHRYEWFTATPNHWQEARTQALTLPAGSWFNRYFVNQIEMVVPYLDNVRPNIRVVNYLLRSHTGKAIRLLPRLLKAIVLLWSKSSARRLIYLGAVQVARLLAPLAAALLLFLTKSGAERWALILFALVALPWLFAQLAKLLHLRYAQEHEEEPRISMARELPELMNAAPFIAVSGHTHKPDKQFWPEVNMTYYNSGTWTPVFEEESGVVRNELTKSFVELHRKSAQVWHAQLKRWENLPKPESELTLLAPRARGQSPETNSPAPVEEKKARPELVAHGNGVMMPASS